MRWYQKTLEIDGFLVNVEGNFDDFVLTISANQQVLYQKEFVMWQYNEILAEDILNRYRSKIMRIERQIPELLKSGKLRT